MTSHAEHIRQHRQLMKNRATPAINRLVEMHPEYAIDPDQSGSASVTNYVIFGRRGDELVVFKYFYDQERRAREIYGLKHWTPTGIVPRLYHDDGDLLIVIERFPGAFLPRPSEESFAEVDREVAGYSLGVATAKFCMTPIRAAAAHDFESRFYDGQKLEEYFAKIIGAGRSIVEKVEAYGADTFLRSLDFLEEQLASILAQPRMLYHQDAQMHFADSRFCGFFDLEMCRVGTQAMQFGSMWGQFAECEHWSHFARGFASESGVQLTREDFEMGRAFAHFMVWRYITRYGEWRGGEGETERASIQDVEQFAADIERWDRVRWEE